MDNEPVVILRQAGIKVVLVPGKSRPIIVEPSHTTSVTIKRSDIPGSPGPEGPPGPRGEKGETGDIAGLDRIDGGSF